MSESQCIMPSRSSVGADSSQWQAMMCSRSSGCSPAAKTVPEGPPGEPKAPAKCCSCCAVIHHSRQSASSRSRRPTRARSSRTTARSLSHHSRQFSSSRSARWRATSRRPAWALNNVTLASWASRSRRIAARRRLARKLWDVIVSATCKRTFMVRPQEKERGKQMVAMPLGSATSEERTPPGEIPAAANSARPRLFSARRRRADSERALSRPGDDGARGAKEFLSLST
mmetsp:Transcript_90871/g.177816  ORF Transcript_90871/g.177816 Transcript_90871/m.177816 type:complete len:228 (-) Transcript_90871:20-703(-)